MIIWHTYSALQLCKIFVQNILFWFQDKLYLVNKLKLEFKNLDQRDNVRRGKSTVEITKMFFRNLSKSQIFNLFKIYQPDFELFGYGIEPYFSMGKEGYTKKDRAQFQ